MGATHGPCKNLSGGIGVPLDPQNNSRRYRGYPRTPRETTQEYWGVLWPQKQPKEVWGPPTCPRRNSVGVPGSSDPTSN